MEENSIINFKNGVNAAWVKNFYYSRASIQKLIFLFNFLNKQSFVESLLARIGAFDFSRSEPATSTLIELNDKLSPQHVVFEFSFGWLWILESHLVYYFKDDFDFDDFYAHFSKIEDSEKIYWGSAEFFDRSIKILDILKKNSFIRLYRDTEFNEKTTRVKKIKKKKIKLNEKESYLFIKNYNAKNIKLVLYFYRI